MIVRFSEEFYRIERVGNRETNNLVDPVDIQVVLHDENHVVYIEGEAVRASRGRYFVDFDTRALQQGHVYSVFWRYTPISDVVQVKRHDFKWDQTFTNSLNGYCLIYGRFEDAVGMPIRNKKVSIVQYDDFAVRNNITSKVDTASDALGQFSFLAKWGGLYQFIYDNGEKKTIIVPEQLVANIDDLDIYQTDDLRVDKFGNPLQVEQPDPILNKIFMGNRFGRLHK